MSENEKPSDLALIGAGYWGKNLARNFHQLGVLRLLCDADEAALGRFRAEYDGLETCPDPEQVFTNGTITRVVIAAPAELHYRLAKRALEAGKDVFVEKPLCLDVAEAEELIRLADNRQRILMVGHLLQYHPCVRKLRDLSDGGELGQLQYITSNRLNLGKIRREENALWSFAPHDLSVILSLAGDRLPKRVTCTGGSYLTSGVADTTLMAMRFANDVRAHVYVSWLNPFKEQKLTVIGSEGMLVFDDTLPWSISCCCSGIIWRGAMAVYRNRTSRPVNRSRCRRTSRCAASANTFWRRRRTALRPGRTATKGCACCGRYTPPRPASTAMVSRWTFGDFER